ncbi:tyrosine-type recombinase/integrase [Nocardia colli]|uniref:tyrosine-type recombinase/integrase n=1 Tax=Nocardia colli TaxID=2545717 RepID=UPI0035D53392
MPSGTKKRANGSGSIYHRKDGRLAFTRYIATPAKERKRITVYGKSRQEVEAKMVVKLLDLQRGRPLQPGSWTVKRYLEYWLENVAAIKNRPRTYEQYESVVRRQLIPGLGHHRLAKLSVYDAQLFLNKKHQDGMSARSVCLIRSVLRTALSRAEREELVKRNVAKLVDVPTWRRKPIVPWSPSEVTSFLHVARDHQWYAAYAILLIYGMRRGEVLGLRWCDINFDQHAIHVRQQLQRIHGKLEQGPVKTSAGVRDLPLVGHIEQLLRVDHLELHDSDHRHTMDENDSVDRQLVFTSSVGTPIDPKNFVRSFHRIREQAGIRRITVHHARHTAATVLKDCDVPVRDAQLILGHSHIMTTMQLYQHGTSERQREAMERISQKLMEMLK